MAKVKLPSYMPESNGRAGDAVFYVRRGTKCMRTYVIPANPDTDKQRETRNSLKSAVKAWQQLSDDVKNIYRKRADELESGLTGYNLFVSEYISRSGDIEL